MRYEQREPATLQGFMAWLRATDIEIKRDMEISRDEVRVMTVHGAKGLEAPVVFLMDTTSTPLDNVRLSLIRFQSATDTTAPPDCVVWAGRKADDPAVVRSARQRMVDDIEHEYRRLLYVAMTRAAERLIVGGVQPGNRKDVPPGSWYQLVTDGLQKSGSGRARDRNQGRRGAALHARLKTRLRRPARRKRRPRRNCCSRRTGCATKAAARRTARSSSGGRRTRQTKAIASARGETARDRQQALRRGVLVHRLLQSLPDIAADRRREAADRYLARNATDWTGRRARGARGANDRPDRRSAFRRAVRAGQPCRGADRRPHRAAGARRRSRFRARSTG